MTIRRVNHFKYLGEIIKPTDMEKQAQTTRIQKVKSTGNNTKNLQQEINQHKNQALKNRNRINGSVR